MRLELEVPCVDDLEPQSLLHQLSLTGAWLFCHVRPMA